MRKYRLLTPMLLGFVAVAGSLPAAAAPDTGQVAAQSSGTARVWFLRPAGSNSYAYGAAPMIYANGTPVADIPANTGFYRDFAPGTYRFTVQPYGSLDEEGRRQAAREAIEQTRSGGDGPLIERACFIAVTEGGKHRCGAILAAHSWRVGNECRAVLRKYGQL